MSEEVKVLAENLKVVDFPYDYFKFAQECRESYYYIKSVKGLLDFHISLAKTYNNKTVKSFNEQIDSLAIEFNEMDNKQIHRRVGRIEDNVDSRDYTHNIEIDEIFDNIVDYIELRAKFDKLQCEVLEYLYSKENELYNAFVERFDDSAQRIIQHEYQKLMMSAYNHSADENKIWNISFEFDDDEVRQALIEEKREGHFKFKVRDYEHRLELARKMYKFERTEALELLNSMHIVEEEKMWKDIPSAV